MTTLHISGFSETTKARELAELFSEIIGDVSSISIPRSPYKPYAFLHFENPEHTEIAIKYAKQTGFYLGAKQRIWVDYHNKTLKRMNRKFY